MHKIAKYTMLLAVAAFITGCSGKPSIKTSNPVDVYPNIWPDYKEVTIPSGIAPLNFNFLGNQYNWLELDITGSISGQLHAEGKSIEMDIDEWHQLTALNMGGQLNCRLSVIYKGLQVIYKEFPIYVSADPLDQYGLTYRLVEPGYVGFGMMGIYQRNLSNFDQEAIFETKSSTGSCVNCHTSNRTNQRQATFHVRGAGGFTMVKNGDDDVRFFNMATDKTIAGCVYPYWHHTGKYIAYSQNITKQVFHSAHPNKIEVFDEKSDIVIYDVDKHELILSPQIKKENEGETFPAFSPDGNTLYYCKAINNESGQYLEDVKYCLMKIAFDSNTGHAVGEPDTLLCIPNHSITLPRPSYDGKYLMFTLADYGTFPIWHHEADLYMIDLQCSDSVKYAPCEALNSNDTESFHNWSANSKWVVISTRRDDGLYTRLYIAHVNSDGTFSKPFILPQKNPVKYYNELFYSYNTPDFSDSPLQTPTQATSRAAANSPQDRERVKAVE